MGDVRGDPHLQGAKVRFGREFARLDGGSPSADSSRLDADCKLYYQGVGRSGLRPYIWLATESANHFTNTEAPLRMCD